LYEERRFLKAAEIADQIVVLAVLPDVAHQDAARAKQGLGDIEAAAGHLRLAARVGPANRKAFHWWTLGSLYFLANRYDDAISALTRASRWGTTDKPLYHPGETVWFRGWELAVKTLERGERVVDQLHPRARADVDEHLLADPEQPVGERNGEVPPGAELVERRCGRRHAGPVLLVGAQVLHRPRELLAQRAVAGRQRVQDSTLKDVVQALALGERADPFLERRFRQPSHRSASIALRPPDK